MSHDDKKRGQFYERKKCNEYFVFLSNAKRNLSFHCDYSQIESNWMMKAHSGIVNTRICVGSRLQAFDVLDEHIWWYLFSASFVDTLSIKLSRFLSPFEVISSRFVTRKIFNYVFQRWPKSIQLKKRKQKKNNNN